VTAAEAVNAGLAAAGREAGIAALLVVTTASEVKVGPRL
jgi:hypothetical protein